MAVVGGLGIFLLGMKNMSEGMQAVAGERLRRMIAAVTDNRFMAVGMGTVITCLVQSSSVTTVIVVGLVNAGFMTLSQSIGVILGANIGTTITGWILVLKVGKYGLPMLGVAAFFYLFGRKDRMRYIAMSIMGLGMVFFGLELMAQGFAPLKNQPWFTETMTWFEADSYFGVLLCVAIGCILTFLVQSSSATLAITIGLASTGAIPFPTAAALVMGENIGTTITAWLASLGANVHAKRAAYGHVLFNVIGALWLTSVFQWYLPIVSSATGMIFGTDPRFASIDSPMFAATVTAGIASVHTGFNVINTLLFVPFLGPFVRLLERLVPDRGRREIPHLIHLDARIIGTPALAIGQSHQEVLKMGEGALKMLRWTGEIALDGKTEKQSQELIRKVFHREEVLDAVEREVVVFLTQTLDGSVPQSVAEQAREQLRITHEYESISDVAASLLKSYLKLKEQKLALSDRQVAALKELHEDVTTYVQMVHDAHRSDDTDVVADAQSRSVDITRRVKKLREEHLQFITESYPDPLLSITYIALLTSYRRAKEHALNVAESIGGKVVGAA